MAMQLYVGQTLTCNNGEEVTVTKVAENTITIEYKGKLYQRPKTIVGYKLFLNDSDKGGSKQDASVRHHRLSAYSRGQAPYVNEHFEERAKKERKRRGKWR